MKRSILGHLLFLLSPDSAPGLSVTGDAALDTAVMGRLNLEPEEGGGARGEGDKGGETPEAKAAREAAEAAAQAKTKGEDEDEDGTETLEEVAARENAALERKEKIDALVAEGKTAEEAEAEVKAEEEAAAVLADGDQVQTPELTEEVKTWHEAQIAAKDEEVAAAKQAAEEAQAKIMELEAQLQSADTQPVAIAPIDPLFLIDDPAKLDVEATKLKEFESWLLNNWDGVEAVEASADGKTKAQPGYSKEQIRQRYAQVKEVRETILPAAREGIKTRKAHEAQARKAYPELFDAKRPESKVAENLLKLAPGLKAVVPNIHIVIGDALRGEKIRIAEEKARATKGKVAPKNTPPKQIAKPSGAQSTVQRPAAKAQGKTEVVDNKKFSEAMEAGSTGRAALVAALT